MGENEFTPEELEILGETPVEPEKVDQETPTEVEGETETEVKEPEPEVKEPEHTEEEKAAVEKMGLRIEEGFIVDADGTKIPPKRWKQMYFESKELERGKTELERKFTLYKELGQEKYYELYPDEKPANWQPQKEENIQTQPKSFDMGEMKVVGGEYDGYTLNEVYQVNPAYATYLQNEYLNSEREKVATVAQQQENIRKESEKELSEFTETLNNEFYPGKKLEELTEGEQRNIANTIQATLDWMSKTKRGSGRLDDAYFLMHREEQLKEAKTKGGKLALESLTKKPVIPSLDNKGGVAEGSNYDTMTTEQLAQKIADMPDVKAMEFMKNASPTIKAKHPTLPWD